MTFHYKSKRLSIIMLVLIALFSVPLGQKQTSAAEAHTIRVVAGETFEIGMETASSRFEFNWILTKDRKFQSAQRNRFFQTRLAEPGTYMLDVSFHDSSSNQNGYHAFAIIVTAPTGAMPTTRGDKTKPLSAILRSDPPALNGAAYLAPEGGLLKIDPSGSDGAISTYHIDLDTSVDTDGDGNLTNDIDNLATLSEKSGTPLYVFMLPKQSERRVKLSTNDLNAVAPATAELSILFAPMPAGIDSTPIVADPHSPMRFQQNGATVRYSAAVGESQAPGTELLYEWDFGDRSKSLLHEPHHTYAAAGTYTVSLVIRNIADASEVYRGSQQIMIDEAVVTSSSSSMSTVSSASSSSKSDGKSSSFSFAGIVKVSVILLFLLALAIGLYSLLTWMKRKTSTSLQKTLENMEGNIVKKDVAIETKNTPVPMKLKKEGTPSVETIPVSEKRVDQEKTPKPPAPPPTPGPTPSWLEKAAAKPSAPPSPRPQSAPVRPPSTPSAPLRTPPPAPKTPVMNVAPIVTPSATAPTIPTPPPAPAQPQAPSAPVPAWLKPAPEAPTPAPATSTVQIQPKPVVPSTAPVEQKPASAPKPHPVPVAEQKPTPAVQPAIPATSPPATPQEKEDSDPTIAIIQADSISK